MSLGNELRFSAAGSTVNMDTPLESRSGVGSAEGLQIHLRTRAVSKDDEMLAPGSPSAGAGPEISIIWAQSPYPWGSHGLVDSVESVPVTLNSLQRPWRGGKAEPPRYSPSFWGSSHGGRTSQGKRG